MKTLSPIFFFLLMPILWINRAHIITMYAFCKELELISNLCTFIYVHKLKIIIMKKVQVNEVRESLAKYLSEAEQGEEIVITRHSKPVARLIAYEEKEKTGFPDLTEFRKSLKVKGKPMSEVVIDMRRNEERF